MNWKAPLPPTVTPVSFVSSDEPCRVTVKRGTVTWPCVCCCCYEILPPVLGARQRPDGLYIYEARIKHFLPLYCAQCSEHVRQSEMHEVVPPIHHKQRAYSYFALFLCFWVFFSAVGVATPFDLFCSGCLISGLAAHTQRNDNKNLAEVERKNEAYRQYARSLMKSTCISCGPAVEIRSLSQSEIELYFRSFEFARLFAGLNPDIVIY